MAGVVFDVAAPPNMPPAAGAVAELDPNKPPPDVVPGAVEPFVAAGGPPNRPPAGFGVLAPPC